MPEINSTFPLGETMYSIPINGSVCAIIEEIDSGTEVFDDTHSEPVPLPGKLNQNYRGYVPWGNDNKLPYKIMEKIRKDEIMSQNKLFNTLTCYASGIRIRQNNGEKITDTEILEWFLDNRMPRYFLEQCTDMKHFFFTVTVLILSRDGKRIVQIRHKDACHVRFETCDPRTGKIENLFYAPWDAVSSSPDDNQIEVIPVLDVWNPLGDLRERINKNKTRDRKFAVINSFPIAGCKYYPFAYYWSVFLSGWYDIKNMIPMGKKAKFRNGTSIRYHVEIHKDYWQNLFREEGITEQSDKLARAKKEKENIRQFLTGIENSGKLWFSGFYIDPNGKEIQMVRINTIDRAKEGGDWIEDSEEAANMICYADNIHPSLVGAVPGKSNNSFSGSVQRELFTIKQALEKPYHDILLEPLFIVKHYNGWKNMKYDVPVITLTTLDKGKDAEEQTLRSE
ncbi:MAG: hypothetical protein LBF79_05660 [Dysgonamonadaceae bacterium]|jgi:hypothetical protein|nr:hypothetical protein [Dysgonamonadaceae bacterium]